MKGRSGAAVWTAAFDPFRVVGRNPTYFENSGLHQLVPARVLQSRCPHPRERRRSAWYNSHNISITKEKIVAGASETVLISGRGLVTQVTSKEEMEPMNRKCSFWPNAQI